MLDRLNEFLYAHTKGELWHQSHPNQLSPYYQNLPKLQIHNEDVYYFNFEKSLNKQNFAIIKESRFTYIPPHTHKDLEMIYIYNGNCEYMVDNMRLHLKQGDIFILDSDVVHSSPSIKNEEDIVINFIFTKYFFDDFFLSSMNTDCVITNFLLQSINREKMHNKFLIFNTTDNERFHTLIQFCLCEYFFPTSIYIQENHLMKQYIILFFLELRNSAYLSNISYFEKEANEKIIDILTYIENNYTHIQLSDVANLFGYNPAYLGTLIKKITGKSFHTILWDLKLKMASQYLKSSKFSTEEIMQLVGCNNSTKFYKYFSKQFGSTPKEYRKYHLNIESNKKSK